MENDISRSGAVRGGMPSEICIDALHEMPVAFALSDAEGKILYENRRFGALFRALEPDCDPLGGEASILDRFGGSVTAADRLMSLSGGARRGETEQSGIVPGPDGRTFRVTVKPVGREQTSSLRLGWCFFDVTVQQDQDARYERIYDRAAIGIFRSTPEGRYFSANPAAVRLHGYDSEAELLDAVADVGEEVYVDPADREALKRALETDGHAFGFESRIVRHKTKEPCWVRQNVWKVADSDGNFLYLEGHVEDITERKNAELSLSEQVEARTVALRRANDSLRAEVEERRQVAEALRASERRFKDIFEAASDWYWEMNAELRFSFVSPRFFELTGITAKNVIGKTRVDLHRGDPDDENWQQHLRDLAAQRPFRNFRFTTALPSGTPIYFSVSGVPVFGDDGRFAGYRGTGTDITAQVVAQQRLAQSEALLRSIVDNSPSVIVVKDMDGRFVFVNEAYVKARGGTVESWIGHEAYGSSPPEHAEAMRAQDREVVERRIAVSRERRTTLDDGTAYHMVVTKFPVLDASGDMIGVASISTDVAELYDTRRALEVSEKRFRSIVDNSPSAIFLKGLDGRYQLANRTFAEWAGIPPSDLVGKNAYDVFARKTAELFASRDAKVLSENRGFERVVDVTFANGQQRMVSFNKFPVSDSDGEIIGVGVIGTDVTDRKRAEDALRESETRLRAIIDNMPAAISLKDRQGRYLLTNKGFEERVNFAARATVGKTVRDLGLDPDIAERLIAHDREVLAAGKVIEEEDRIHLNNKTYDRSVTKFPVFDANGNVGGIGTVSVDISDRKAMQAQLQQAQKMEAVGQLTGGVAHDFNNLLGVIIGNLDILNEGLKDDDARQKQIESALRSALRGAELTSRLLAFSRKQSLRPVTTDLNRLVSGMTDLIRRTLGETIAVRTVSATDLWETKVDPGQMEAALLNLAVNARHAMPDGGELIVETANAALDQAGVARFDGLQAGRYAMLSVSDTGTGIAPNALKHVFEPFFTTKGVGEGSGLGLSMVHGFVTQSGGHVEISSEPGIGTTVRLYLPVVDDEPPALKHDQTNIAGPRGRGELILVVEDDSDLRVLSTTTMRGLGYRTLEASDGAAALELLAGETAVDLLFTDVVLPGGMNGVALAKSAQERRPGIKVLYTSGYTEIAVARSGVLRAGENLLAKPFRRDHLARRLRDVLDAE